MARQVKNEGPQEFADRCRALAQKVMCKDSVLVAQRIHRENAKDAFGQFCGWFIRRCRSSGSISEPSDSAACFIHCAFSQRGGKAGDLMRLLCEV